MVKPRSRTELVINSLIALPVVSSQQWRTPENSSRILMSLKSRHSGGQEKVLISLLETSVASSAIAENILDCLTSAMVLSKLSLLSRGFYHSIDTGNSNSRSGFHTLSINQNFSASVNEQMTQYTVPISISKQSSFRQTGSFESSDAMRHHSDRVVHD